MNGNHGAPQPPPQALPMRRITLTALSGEVSHFDVDSSVKVDIGAPGLVVVEHAGTLYEYVQMSPLTHYRLVEVKALPLLRGVG